MPNRLATLLVTLSLSLAPACVGSKKPQPEKVPASLTVESLPQGAKKLNANFDGKVTLLGYEVDAKDGVKAGDKVSYTLYWRVDKAIGSAGWNLFTHVLADKRRVLNIDEVGPLRASSAPEPSKWELGKIYKDEQSFKVPSKVDGETLSVVVGIWKGKKRLKLESGPSAGENRAVAFKLRVTGEKAEKPNTRVPQLRVDKLEKGTKITIDGKLDEPAWQTAAATGPFVNVSTGKLDKSAKVQGEAKLLWDETGLYVGFNVTDSDVVGGFSKTEKDPHLWTKDTVEVMIDPDGDGDNKDYYEVQVNPQNLVFDSRFDDYNKPRGGKDGPFGHQEWSSKVESAVVVDGTLDKPGDEDKGYVVELKIPWQSFDKAKKTPPDVGSEWRINLYAMQNNGGVAWSPILGQGNFHKASRFGRVLFAEKGWEPAMAQQKAGGATEVTSQAGAGTDKSADVSDSPLDRQGVEAKTQGKLPPPQGAQRGPVAVPTSAQTPGLKQLEPKPAAPAAGSQ